MPSTIDPAGRAGFRVLRGAPCGLAGTCLALALAGFAPAVRAEEPAKGAPQAAAAAETAAERIELDTGSFLFARYASVNASALYGGVGFGRAGMFFGIVQNPRSGYRELLAGGMTRIAWRRHSLIVGLAGADASDGDYAQLYLVPGLSWGSLSLDGTVEWYEPLGAAGTRQLEINPVQLFWRLGQRVRIGASYVGSFSPEADSRHRAGPSLRLAIRGATLEAEWLAGLENADDELRVAIRASF